MKITKETTISLGTIIAILPLAFWFFTSKADRKDVEKVEVKVEKAKDELVERKLIDREQSIYIEQMQKNQLKFIEEFKELQQAK